MPNDFGRVSATFPPASLGQSTPVISPSTQPVPPAPLEPPPVNWNERLVQQEPKVSRPVLEATSDRLRVLSEKENLSAAEVKEMQSLSRYLQDNGSARYDNGTQDWLTRAEDRFNYLAKKPKRSEKEQAEMQELSTELQRFSQAMALLHATRRRTASDYLRA